MGNHKIKRFTLFSKRMQSGITTLLLFLILSVSSLSAQSPGIVRGSVVDHVSGEPLIGVSILLKGTATGTITDVDGNFSISVPANKIGNAILVFSYMGYVTQEVAVKGANMLDIKLKEDVEKLEEVVVVGYGTQKRVNMTGAVSAMKSETVKTLPVANISNAIGGRVSGLVTQQATGEPGNDASKIYLRGTEPLVLVDGIATDYNKVNMNDVETITLLKDASAVAPYGLNGANGVMLITTKRGKTGKIKVSFDGEFGWQKPTNTPDFMDAAGTLILKREAYLTAGDYEAAAKITDEDIAESRLGTDAHPNTDWISNYMKSSTSQKYNVTLNGGNEFIKANVGLGYMKQGSMFGEGQGYERYNLRSNFDFKVTKTTNFSTDITITSDEKKSHALSAKDIMGNLYRAKPDEPDVYSNGFPAWQESVTGSLYQLVHGGGDKLSKNNYQLYTFTLEQQLPFVKGLSVKGLFNINRKEYSAKDWGVPYDYYKYDAPTNTYSKNTLNGTEELTLKSQVTTLYKAQGYINYNNQFGDHGLTGLFVYERNWGGTHTDFSGKRTGFDILIPELDQGDLNNQYASGKSKEEADDGFVLRVNYDYKQKYMLEIAGRYDRTYRYAPGKRDAVFPSASVGWRISEEPFFEPLRSVVDNLKIRASYGKSGKPTGEPFSYYSKYEINTNSYIWGLDKTTKGLYESAEPNPNLTWETVWKANVGFDLNMWNGLLGLEFDVYRDFRTDKLGKPTGGLPAEYGIEPAQENGNEEERYGVDFTITNTTRIGSDFKINNAVVFGFSRNKQTYIMEEDPGTLNIPQFRKTGHSSSLFRGYVAEGLFKDEEDIANSPFISANTKPGDVKYKDLNGDGKIDDRDQTIIGKTRVPEIMYGYTLGLNYKGFDLNVFLQGTGNSDFYLGTDASNNSDRGVRVPFENGKPRAEHADSWSVNNQNPNAKYPRLSPQSDIKSHMNYAASTFWMVNTAYLKLKSLELGYNLPNSLVNKVGIEHCRLYLNFYNLWTIYSNMPKDFDVENQNYNAYPQQFITSLGVNVTF